MHVVFGDCEFDSGRHLVLRHGRPVPLSPRAFQFLDLLLDRRPEAISKTELLECLWPGTFVSDASLHNLVAEVRAALGDSPRVARYIRTIPRFGYAFHGDARPLAASSAAASPDISSSPRLISTRGDWLLSEGENIVGRDAECAVRIQSPTVSRRHARIVVKNGAASVEDLKSKNGTYVDGKAARHALPLNDGDQVRVGSVTMTYRTATRIDSTLSLGKGSRS